MRGAQRRPFRLRLLHAVLAEHALARRDHRLDRVRRKCLRHRDQRHRRRIALRLGACRGDLVAHAREASGGFISASIRHSSRKFIPPIREVTFPAPPPDATNGAGIQRRDFTVTPAQLAGRADMSGVDSTYAWIRLFVALVLGTIGSVGMWSYVVALPPVQADFGILRNAASLPYTMAMIGFAFGGVAMGRLRRPPRHRVSRRSSERCCSASAIVGAGYAPNIWLLNAAHLVIGFGTLGDVRTDRLRHVALVQEAARRRDRHRVMRQLSRPAPSGRRSCSTSSPATAGARRISASASSASSR